MGAGGIRQHWKKQGTGEHPRLWDGQSVGRLLGGGPCPDAEGQKQQESKGWEATGLEVAEWGGGGGASGQHLLPGTRQQGRGGGGGGRGLCEWISHHRRAPSPPSGSASGSTPTYTPIIHTFLLVLPGLQSPPAGVVIQKPIVIPDLYLNLYWLEVP